MFTIRKLFKFEAAHQLKEAYSACCKDTIHGHSYIIEVFFESRMLDNTGMVIDFGKVSDAFKSCINDFWDHCLFMPDTFDKEYLGILNKYNTKIVITNYNPTAENMALELYNTFRNILHKLDLDSNLIKSVRVHETTTGWAEYEANI